ncbi:hypothetical protein ACWEO1_22510 [Kitasatospora cineracea]
MKINRQGAMIAASVTAVLVIAGGSAWALNSGSSTGQQQVQQADVADTSTPSPSATANATASPTDTPTTAAPATTAPETTTAPAATLPAASPTSTKKANTVSTPTSEPTTEHPVSTDPPGAVAGQWNGGTGTVDNGPYPSRGPVSTEIPRDPGGPAPDPRVSPSSTSTP